MGSMELPWGQGETLPVKLPPAWRLVAESDLKTPPPVPNLSTAVREALDRPIGIPPLRQLVTQQTRVALVMDDAGRPTPVPRLAPVVLDYLLKAGARPNNINGLFALGTHELMSQEAMEARAGTFVASHVQYALIRIDLGQFDHLFTSRLPAQVFGEIQIGLELEDELLQIVSLIRG